MACFEQHGEHLAPQFGGLDALEQFQLARPGLLFVLFIAFCSKARPYRSCRSGASAGREQGPVAVLCYALHEQVRYPVRGVHVVGATAIIAGVLAQLQTLRYQGARFPGRRRLRLCAYRPDSQQLLCR